MILSGNTKYTGTPKLPEHSNLDEIKAMASPRVLALHTPFELLPEQVKDKKPKIIYLLRNPKDVMVSLYHFFNNSTGGMYTGNFRGFFKLFLQRECKWFKEYDPETLDFCPQPD